MTFSLRRKRPTTAPAKSTRSRTALSLLAAAAVLACAPPAAAQDPAGQPRSTFVPRGATSRTAPPAVIQAQLKDAPKLPPAPPATPKTTDQLEAYIRLDPPGRERLFGSRDTERELEQRMRQERKDAGGPDQVVFPEKPVLPFDEYKPRKFDPLVALAEPAYVVYRPLYFEEKNSERYGWDMGPIQPLFSTLVFYKDVALWPMRFAAYPCRRFDTNAGQCQPGDPVPYIWYPPEITGTGLLAEVGTIALLYSAVP